MTSIVKKREIYLFFSNVVVRHMKKKFYCIFFFHQHSQLESSHFWKKHTTDKNNYMHNISETKLKLYILMNIVLNGVALAHNPQWPGVSECDDRLLRTPNGWPSLPKQGQTYKTLSHFSKCGCAWVYKEQTSMTYPGLGPRTLSVAWFRTRLLWMQTRLPLC